jgi:quercetin dioxygenase-like cupin family protein
MHRGIRFAVATSIALCSAQGAIAEPALAIAATDSKIKWGPCPDFMPKGCGLAVLHGDPAQHNADVFLKLPPGSKIPNHWHTSAERMILVAGELQVTSEREPSVTLKPGMYAYGPAKHVHSAVCSPADACVLFIAFESPIDAVAAAVSAK